MTPTTQPTEITRPGATRLRQDVPMSWLLAALLAVLVITVVPAQSTSASAAGLSAGIPDGMPPVPSASPGHSAEPSPPPTETMDARPSPVPTASSQVDPNLPASLPDDTSPPIEHPVREATPGLGRQSYHFVATLDSPARTLDVVETLDWTNTSPAAVTSIDLSVIPAQVDAFALTGQVTVDGVSADAAFTAYATNLRVTFREPVVDGQSVRIVVPFRLQISETEGALGGRLAVHRGIFQFGEWFPIWSTVHGFSAIGDPQVSWNAETMVLDLTSTTKLGIDAVAATGVLQAGATDDHWIYEAQNVRDFAFTVNPAYRVATREIECEGQSTKIRAYVDRASSSTLLDWATEAMSSFSGWYGCYTYPVFSIAEVGSPVFSMEFPNIVFIATMMISEKRNVVHEIAHQWWYGMVGNDQIEQPWVDESFAEYSELLLIGGWSYCSTKPVRTPIYEFTRWSGCDGYFETVYHQGAAFLKKVRERMGDRDFFGALKEIVSEYRYGFVTTADVLDILGAKSSVQLEDLIVQFGLSTT